ncbi:hypothetical protein HCH_03032 [Hahella chejuensis KCTC 2396]|uniref:Uncharacterized protein n=1 Tax=Hahella chejuensis (strain KCTC 2396) TaxID=349521 RepID=Q2SHS6_HAHCH|nr:hypothetical protein HCH_03032 [Hahella chejuensis KCTC 2396]
MTNPARHEQDSIKLNPVNTNCSQQSDTVAFPTFL